MKKTIILSTIITSLFLTNANAIDPVSAVVVGSSVIGAGASVYTASKANDTNKKVNNLVAQNNKSNGKTINAIKCYVPVNYYKCHENNNFEIACYDINKKDTIFLALQSNRQIKYPVIIETVETLKYHKCELI